MTGAEIDWRLPRICDFGRSRPIDSHGGGCVEPKKGIAHAGRFSHYPYTVRQDITAYGAMAEGKSLVLACSRFGFDAWRVLGAFGPASTAIGCSCRACRSCFLAESAFPGVGRVVAFGDESG